MAFIVKAVYLGDLTGFVIPPDEGDTFWITDFKSEEEKEGFYAVESAIDKVA